MLPSTRSEIVSLIEGWGGRYSSDLGIDLSEGRPEEIFKWFLASILFGARINEKLAIKTYKKFAENDLLSPESIVNAGWDRLVKILDSGGYTRYNFKTADKLLAVTQNLMERYNGDLNKLHKTAKDSADLEAKIMALGKGLGEVTVNIFLRELREIWDKADPLPQNLALEGAENLGFIDKGESGKIALEKLERIWRNNNIPEYRFADFEAALVKLRKSIRKTAHNRRHVSVV